MAFAAPPKPTIHDRKRHGDHHRRSKHYLKPYLPYLPMLLIVGLGLVINTAWNKSAVLGAATINSSTLLSDTNTERIQNSEPALILNQQLGVAAQAKADDMARSNYWAHNSPDGKTPWSFIAASGYHYKAAGENLAYGFANADDAVKGWMNSPEHRANILNDTYRDVGFGVATAPNYLGHGPQTIIVAEYAQPVLAAATATPAQANVLGAQTKAAELASQPVSRIQILAGDHAEWSLIAVIVLSGGAMIIFLLRHGYRLHRWATQTEMYIVHHPYIDITVVLIITAGCILTRTSGIIR